VRRNLLLIDTALAVALAAIVLIVAPGLAVAGIIAVLVLFVCGISFGVGRVRRGRRAPRRGRRATVARRPPQRRPFTRPSGAPRSTRPPRRKPRRPSRGR